VIKNRQWSRAVAKRQVERASRGSIHASAKPDSFSDDRTNWTTRALGSTEDRNPMREAILDSKSERAAVAAPGVPVVASSRPCPVCGQAMTGRKTSACSDRCRAAKSRRKRVPLPVDKYRDIRASLTAALEAVWEARAALERYGSRNGGSCRRKAGPN
jgi:hypothetical protein